MGNTLRQGRMDKVTKRGEKRVGRQRPQQRSADVVVLDTPQRAKRAVELKAQTKRQQILINTIIGNVCTVANGPAGTGKTHIAIAVCLKMLLNNELDVVYLTKSFFEIDEKLAALPGDEQEKLAVQMRNMRIIGEKVVGKGHFEYLESVGKVQFVHLGSILGMTFDRAGVVIDEAQTTTVSQMKALLTRTGNDTKVIVAGDYRGQKFIEGRCGMEDMVRRFRGSKMTGIVNFTLDDVVRSGFCREAIEKYMDIRDDLESLDVIEHVDNDVSDDEHSDGLRYHLRTELVVN